MSLRFTAVTLFPEMFNGIRSEGVVARGIKNKAIELETVFIRDFAKDERRSVDEHPIGGGDGMVLRPDVMEDAIRSVKTSDTYVVNLTPAGKVFDHEYARHLAKKQHVLLLCGRYAGFDERVLARHVDLHLSVGDFVLSGGELPAMCVIDAVSRFVPGVLGNESSAGSDSFEDGLLEAPSYTKPLDFQGMEVPEVLLSGDHKKIREYRRREQLRVTAERRPDLIQRIWDKLSRSEQGFVESCWKHR